MNHSPTVLRQLEPFLVKTIEEIEGRMVSLDEVRQHGQIVAQFNPPIENMNIYWKNNLIGVAQYNQQTDTFIIDRS
jgi:hypothetical protein